jgi:excisionase family DNA binding protein
MVDKKGFIRSVFDEGNVVTVIGAMGSGKTDKACLFMEKAVECGFHCHTVINFFESSDIKKAIKLGKLRLDIDYINKPSEIHIVKRFSELLLGLLEYKNNIVFLDEAALFASSNEPNSKRVRMLKQLTYIIRHLDASIVFICQSGKSLVPDLRRNLVSYQIQIKKISENNRMMIISKPDKIINEYGDESFEFRIIDVREKMPCSHLPYDSKYLPSFKFDIDIDTLLDSIGGLNSIQVREKGRDIIIKIINKKTKNMKDIKSTMSTTEYAKKRNVHSDTVRRWIKENKIDYVLTEGGHYRIPV